MKSTPSQVNRVIEFKKKPKYGNKKTEFDGLKFDSRKEFARYMILKQDAEVKDLQTQVTFQVEVNGVKVCKYIADFVYIRNGLEVIEDVKSEITRKEKYYRLKKKLFEAATGKKIIEF